MFQLYLEVHTSLTKMFKYFITLQYFEDTIFFPVSLITTTHVSGSAVDNQIILWELINMETQGHVVHFVCQMIWKHLTGLADSLMAFMTSTGGEGEGGGGVFDSLMMAAVSNLWSTETLDSVSQHAAVWRIKWQSTVWFGNMIAHSEDM